MLQRARRVVAVQTGGPMFLGYVLSHNAELLLEVYTPFAEADGHSVLDVDSVGNVVWSNEDTRTIELLLKQRGAAG